MNLHNDSIWLGTLIKDRIDDIVPVYPLAAEQGTAMPYAVYRRAGLGSDMTKDGFASDGVSIVITIVASTYIESLSLAEKVRAELDGLRGRWKERCVHMIRLVNATEEWNNAYVQTLTFNFDID